MAGHPTIGTTFALAAEGVIATGRGEFVFELGVGPVPVALEWGTGGLSFAWMTQPLPQFGSTLPDRRAFAAAVGLQPSDLAAGLPVQSISCGVPFLFVPLASRAAVDTVALDARALARCCREAGLDVLPIFFFTTARGGGDETVYSRMLAPGFGISEDPATGSASGPLGCYLLRHGVVSPDQAQALLSLQGVAMRRPSRIHISIDSRDGEITRVRVGGEAVRVAEGVLRVAG
jgi:trans-2,3-dihydro-3-hydroxyanthranilate isomerase